MRPDELYLDPLDTFYSPALFGPMRLDVPHNYQIYTYLNATARFYYLPGFLRLAVLDGEDALDLVSDILRDLTEPNFDACENRYAVWSLLLEVSESERRMIAASLPILEDIARHEEETDACMQDRNRRNAMWIHG